MPRRREQRKGNEINDRKYFGHPYPSKMRLELYRLRTFHTLKRVHGAQYLGRRGKIEGPLLYEHIDRRTHKGTVYDRKTRQEKERRKHGGSPLRQQKTNMVIRDENGKVIFEPRKEYLRVDERIRDSFYNIVITNKSGKGKYNVIHLKFPVSDLRPDRIKAASIEDHIISDSMPKEKALRLHKRILQSINPRKPGHRG